MEKQQQLSICCISHEFFKSASKHPDKIAVIQSRGGGAQLAREFRELYDHHNQNDDAEKPFDKFFATDSPSSRPPVYEGDECFTYSQVLAAVDSLSSRLRRILDGGGDPQLITPTSVIGLYNVWEAAIDGLGFGSHFAALV
ncbi:hypothetical protein RJ640_025747 [Escallonia rubra]|uniref:Uncharacterized protein n=1 Tax=Escallonia rubra TaxID=112253 RepID=A0AA88S4H9_9ASTE|nr:hypothetical protein RJ640_025747 [Escallonia rubra]